MVHVRTMLFGFLVVFAGAVCVDAALARDAASMSHDEIVALQQRLTDDQCYTGAADGVPSEALDAAIKQCPGQDPVLRIETETHTAKIWRIGVDRDCRLAITGSEDKTVRLWSLPDGKLLRTMRLPIDEGDYGKIFAVALSPDGRQVAVAGIDAGLLRGSGYSLSIFDSLSGDRMRRIGSLGQIAYRIAFSGDGSRVAVALWQGGVRVFDVASGQELMADTDFSGQSYGLSFAADGSLYATALDGFLRRYGPDLKRTAKIKLPGSQPYTIAVDPTETRLAVGYMGSPRIDLYTVPTLRLIGSANTRGIGDGAIGNVAWFNDGRLIAGATYGVKVAGHWMDVVRTFDARGRTLGRDTPVSADTIMDLETCGTAVAYVSADPSMGLIGSNGVIRSLTQSRNADMRNKLDQAFMVSDDGARIAFGLGIGNDRPVAFDLNAGTISNGSGNAEDLHQPDYTGTNVDDWLRTETPHYEGRTLAVETGEESHALVLRADRSGFVLGAQLDLHSFDANGTERWRRRSAGEVWGVNLARNGDLIVAAETDGTIRWHRWSDGKELLALFVDAPTKRWVAWTPTGYYKASPGGEDLIGWHMNRGWDQQADFFPASKFRDQFSRPDIVDKVLVTLDEDEAVKKANAARHLRPSSPGSITDKLPPVLSILSPADGANVDGEVRIDYLVRSPSGLPVDAVEARINGHTASAARGFDRMATPNDVLECLSQTRGFGRMQDGIQGCRGHLTVTLPPGKSEVGLIARSGDRTSVVTVVRLARASAPTPAETKKPKLYALVVGISAYKNRDYRLAFPAKDAHDFAEALANQKGGLYGEVEVKLLSDEGATAGAIRDGLDWLTHAVAAGDTGIIYLSGHGVLDDRERFYFLAADSDVTRLRASAVPREDIADALDGLAGNALLFLDACHAGAVAGVGRVDINGIVNAFSSSDRGVVTFAASTGKQVSQENIAWGNGAFTKAVVEGLGLPGTKGKASFGSDGEITSSELDFYVRDRVKKLTDGTQSPVMIRPGTVPDFPFAIAR